jgi:hypothetical protein
MKIQVFDIKENTWNSLPSMMSARSDAAAATFNEKGKVEKIAPESKYHK